MLGWWLVSQQFAGTIVKCVKNQMYPTKIVT